MLFLFLIFLYVSYIQAEVVVNTSRGFVAGYHVDYGNDMDSLYYGQADVFLGIPYAAPPVGKLRFQKTLPISRLPNFYTSSSPWNATYFRPACPQYYATDDQMSEDCLYLNIITPNASSDTKYPVMVWIHGGGLFTGSMRSDVSEYYSVKGGIRNLVSRGVVLVNIQYRIGLLGFFTTLTDDFPANLGLLDQVLALQFIKEEIAHFGGDPSKITLFGNSAGGCSISAHTYSSLSQGLFHQAIMESGTIWTCFDNAIGSESALSLSFKRAQSLCNYTQEMWETKNYSLLQTCLLQTDYHDFLTFDRYDNFLGWKITVDGYFLLDSPENLWKTRPNIPIIMGTNKDEWSTWCKIRSDIICFRFLVYYGSRNLSMFNSNMLLTTLNKYAPKLVDKNPNIIDVLADIFSSNIRDDDNLGWLKILSQIFSGAFFTSFTGREVDFYLLNNNLNVYLYEFTWPTHLFHALDVAGWSPVQHATERYYIWMPEKLWDPTIEKGLVNKTDIEIADAFGEFWTHFAKHGNPSLKNQWAPVNSTKIKPYFELGLMQRMRLGYRILDQYVWNEIISDIVSQWPIN